MSAFDKHPPKVGRGGGGGGGGGVYKGVGRVRKSARELVLFIYLFVCPTFRYRYSFITYKYWYNVEQNVCVQSLSRLI